MPHNESKVYFSGWQRTEMRFDTELGGEFPTVIGGDWVRQAYPTYSGTVVTGAEAIKIREECDFDILSNYDSKTRKTTYKIGSSKMPGLRSEIAVYVYSYEEKFVPLLEELEDRTGIAPLTVIVK